MTRLAIVFERGAVNNSDIVLGDGPMEYALAGQFLGGFGMGFDGLREPRRAAIPNRWRTFTIFRANTMLAWIAKKIAGFTPC